MNAKEVLDALERSFSQKAGYVLVRELQLGPSGRRVDAVALQMYGSRGIHLHGIEVKVDRRDWQRELQNARKADELARYCRHYSVAAPAGLIDVTEVPEQWGFIEIRGVDRKVFHVRKAPAADNMPLDAPTVARLVVRSLESIRRPGEKALEAYRERGYQEGLRAGVDQERYEQGRTKSWEQTHRDLRDRVTAFEAASGIQIDRWLNMEGAAKLGADVRLVREFPRLVARCRQELLGLSDDLREAAGEKVGRDYAGNLRREPLTFEQLMEKIA